MTKDEPTKPGEPADDPFKEVLKVMNLEHLLKFKNRLSAVKKKHVVKLFEEEIKSRNGVEGCEADQALVENAKKKAKEYERKKQKKQKK